MVAAALFFVIFITGKNRTNIFPLFLFGAANSLPVSFLLLLSFKKSGHVTLNIMFLHHKTTTISFIILKPQPDV